MSAVVMLREAASQTMNFDMAQLPYAQSVLIDLFSRCGAETSVEDVLEGMSRVGPDGVMDAVVRRIAIRLLGRLPSDRLVSDVQNELAQDLDTDALAECRVFYETLSQELRRDAAAVRGLGIIAISQTQGEVFARDLEAKAAKAEQLERRIAALEAQVRASMAGSVRWVHAMSSTPRPHHIGLGERA
ncbi:hypothetical protein AD945_00625 [Gluconobacter albidus]|uniref:Uncharacterized protein n=1 Tax=Gluconobacter albidus TaxID=318683 RepID=A0A149TNK4_9PROT|nr:hypothetical protein [Gluconobacter albidus]KXV51165.1 hypothetical protein AD945_00625 [Gluconobacter albidus]